MNLDELRAVGDEERSSGELQPLRPSFYAEARAFIAEIAAERDRRFDASDDPLADPEVSRLNDKHTTATTVLGSIFENRVSKLLTHAMTVAAGEGSEPPPMTSEEAELYRVVVGAIRETRSSALEGTAEASPGDEAPAGDQRPPATDPEAVPDPADGDVDGAEPDSGEDRLLVRVVDDVGTILGVDEREYDLTAGDVVSLPVENARALIEREAAEPVQEA